MFVCLLCFLLSRTLYALCPWPLRETKHNHVVMYYNDSGTVTPCAIGCGTEPPVAIFFKVQEQEALDQLNVFLSFAAMTFTILFGLNLCLQKKETRTSLCEANLSYQIPFLINIGYFLCIISVLFHPGSILIKSNSPTYCNRDEKTLFVHDPANGNLDCTIFSLFVFITIWIIISYTTLLSIVLFRLFWFPFSQQSSRYKCIAHSSVLTVVAIQSASVFGLHSMEGHLAMRICLPTSNGPNVTLWLWIIPLLVYQTVATVLLFSCVYKLWKMWVLPTNEDEQIESIEEIDSAVKMFPLRTSHKARLFKPKISLKAKDDSLSKLLRELTVRVLIFNIFQSICVSLLCFNLIWWYKNFDKWEKVAANVISCQVQTYGIHILEGTEDADGTLLKSAYDCVDNYDAGPSDWSYWLFFFVTMGGAFSGFILTCSKHTMKNYKRAIISLKTTLGSSIERRYTKERKIGAEMVPVQEESLSQKFSENGQYQEQEIVIVE